MNEEKIISIGEQARKEVMDLLTAAARDGAGTRGALTLNELEGQARAKWWAIGMATTDLAVAGKIYEIHPSMFRLPEDGKAGPFRGPL